MRIVDVTETAVPLKSTLSNSSFDFREMTTSVVAVITDVVREGRPVTGYAFNSTGRYACGAQMRARFIPRILTASPDSLLNAAKDNLEPEKILACMMQREKPGGHTERSIAIGTIEVAVWDAVAKDRRQAALPRAGGALQRGRAPEKVPCYVGGRWYPAGKGHSRIAERDPRAAGRRVHHAMKIKVGGATIPEDVKRVEAALEVVAGSRNLAVDANGAFDRAARWPTRRRSRRSSCAGSRSRPIRSPTSCSLRSPRITKRRSAPARISSPPRTWRIWCASAACAPIATSSRSMCRSPMASCSSRARWRCSRSRGWRRSAIFPHGGNQMTLHIVGGFGLGGCEAYPGVFGVFAGFADEGPPPPRARRGGIIDLFRDFDP